MSEDFRDIPGWPGYRISANGIVQSLRNSGTVARHPQWKTLKPRLAERGYLGIGLKCHPRRTFIPIHVLILMAWVGPRPEGFHGCHNNGDKLDNRLENLRWDTASENMLDIARHGRLYGFQKRIRFKPDHRKPRLSRMLRGEKKPAAKLSYVAADDIRRRHAAGVSQSQLAREYGVHQVAVWQVIHEITWKPEFQPEGLQFSKRPAVKPEAAP